MLTDMHMKCVTIGVGTMGVPGAGAPLCLLIILYYGLCIYTSYKPSIEPCFIEPSSYAYSYWTHTFTHYIGSVLSDTLQFIVGDSIPTLPIIFSPSLHPICFLWKPRNAI